jgi:hypothetical protein
MILLLLLIALFLTMWMHTKDRLEQANEDIRREWGDAYNPDAAGHPARDAAVIVTFALLGALLLAGLVAPALIP